MTHPTNRGGNCKADIMSWRNSQSTESKAFLKVYIENASGRSSFSTILPEELLQQENIFNHASVLNKGSLSWGGQGKFGGLREDKPGHTLSGHLFNSSSGMPWMLLGDFNNVLSIEEKANGLPVTPYEMRDFKSCCYDTGMSDIRSSGVFFTWSNNAIWSKLDRVMVNRNWVHEGLQAHARFDLPGKFSDHSPYIVGNTWGMHLRGTAMFKFCKKLKAVKDPQKDLNKQHFSHIAARAEASEEDLTRARQQLHDSPEDQELPASIPELRAKAIKLAEAELSYCSQLAKAKYLKNSDKCSKFFHDLIKSNRAKNHIASISLEDGSRTTSSKQVSEAFVMFYNRLLGTKSDSAKLN
ncbi:hypothetical protein Acr_03g0012330, partial [Actinidia rufa]